jgi:hypothetical protein
MDEVGYEDREFGFYVDGLGEGRGGGASGGYGQGVLAHPAVRGYPRADGGIHARLLSGSLVLEGAYIIMHQGGIDYGTQGRANVYLNARNQLPGGGRRGATSLAHGGRRHALHRGLNLLSS